MRARVWLAGAVLCVATVTGCSAGHLVLGSGGEAACAAPIVTVTPQTVAPGGAVTVAGENFLNACDDVGGVVDGTPLPSPSVGPSVGSSVLLVEGTATQELATVDAATDGRFSVEVTIPADATPGPAAIRVSTAPDDAPLTIQAATSSGG